VAGSKQTVTQRNMSLMEVREDLLEAKDLEVRRQSLRRSLNMRSLAPGAIERRPGLLYRRTLTDAGFMREITPASGVRFAVMIGDDLLEVIDEDARVVFSASSVPWDDASEVYIEDFRENTVIGGAWGFYNLLYDAGTWTFGAAEFADAIGGEAAQPYWSFRQDISMQPSARDGNITLTSSLPFWTAGYVGQRVRYGFREVLISNIVSPTVAQGIVVSTLPPTFNVTLTSPGEFQVGEVVIGQDTDFQGQIVAVSGATLTVVTGSFFDGPDVGEKLSGSSSSVEVASKVEVAPAASPVWDEPLMSPVRGYPRSGAAVAGRLVLIDFPLIPDLIVTSSSRDIFDFAVGSDDDDAIVRQAGDNAPRFLHAVNMGDLLILSDRGCYFLPTRDNGVLTPLNFNLVRFDQRAASEVRPVAVEDGVIFVEASGQAIAAALLDGNVYLKWSVRTITLLHNHLVKSPVALCGPALSSASPEKYMFVVNGDGTLAALSWNERIGAETIGFAPWETSGRFIAVAPMFAGYWCIVERTINNETVRFLEEFSADAQLDCAVIASFASQFDTLEVNGEILEVNGADLVVVQPAATHLAGGTVAIGGPDFYAGEYGVSSDGTIASEPSLEGERQFGLRFTSTVSPWAVELIESPRAGMLRARVIRFAVSVQDSASFMVWCNRTSREVGGYAAGDPLDVPPPLRTQVYRFPVLGDKKQADLGITKDTPGRLRILALTQEVQA